MKVVKVVRKHYKVPVPVYDLSMKPGNPCFSLEAGVISHNTITAGSEIRQIFIPRDKGNLLCHADYSQMELRVLALFADEKDMIEGIS